MRSLDYFKLFSETMQWFRFSIHVQFCHNFHHIFLGHPKEKITITFRIRFKFISQAQGEERGGEERGTGEGEWEKGKWKGQKLKGG